MQGVLERVENDRCDDAGVEEKWSAVKTALFHTAEDVLGGAVFLQPDWFQESLEALQPLLIARNAAYSWWVRTGNLEDLSKFRLAKSTVRKRIRKAKNDWFQKNAGK